MKRIPILVSVLFLVAGFWSPAVAEHEHSSAPQAPAPELRSEEQAPPEPSPAGDRMPPGPMMGGMMPGRMMGAPMSGPMMGPCMEAGKMPCRMMGTPMSGPMMGPCMETGKMLPPKVRCCQDLLDALLPGNADLRQIGSGLGLSGEQSAKIEQIIGGLRRKAIGLTAELRIAELDVADLLAAEPVDMGKVESKLKEAEGAQTSLRLNHIKAVVEIRQLLDGAQMEKLEKMMPEMMRGRMGSPGMSMPCPMNQ